MKKTKMMLTLSLAASMTLALSFDAQAKQVRSPRRATQVKRYAPLLPSVTIIAGGISTCRSRAFTAVQRRACLACVVRGGVFPLRRDGRGRCKSLDSVRNLQLPRVAPIKLRSARQCLTGVKQGAKKQRCLACVRWGGVFDRRGGGSCEVTRTPGIGVKRHYDYVTTR